MKSRRTAYEFTEGAFPKIPGLRSSRPDAVLVTPFFFLLLCLRVLLAFCVMQQARHLTEDRHSYTHETAPSIDANQRHVHMIQIKYHEDSTWATVESGTAAACRPLQEYKGESWITTNFLFSFMIINVHCQKFPALVDERLMRLIACQSYQPQFNRGNPERLCTASKIV
eukprot:1161919-Pelagomonas_calceolata.AAC.2